MSEATKQIKQAPKTVKKDRIGFSKAKNLQLSTAEQEALNEAGWYVRWVNDYNGRVQQAEAAGYDFVDPEHAKSVGGADANGKVSKVVSRKGENIRAYLMQLPMAWREADLLEKREKNNLIDQALKPVQQGGQSIEGGYTPK